MLQRIKAILKRRGFAIHTRPFELNIVGLRSKNTSSNKFDDEIHVFYKTGKRNWNYHLFKATTDPGTFWLKNPSYPEGTAILKEGLYYYKIGMHQNKYKALVQAKPVTVMRDYDRNAILDFKNGKLFTGWFGINIHHALAKGKTFLIDKFSAGCQVFQSAGDFEQFMALCERHRSLYGNLFTYALIDFRAVQRITLKRIAMAASFISTLIFGLIFNSKGKKRKRK